MQIRILKASKRAKWTAGIVVVLGALAVPLPHTIAPAWAPGLVDISGIPQVGIEAVQSWRHPLFQPELRQETQLSDVGGRVTYPERTAWTSGFTVLYRAAGSFATAGLGASLAPDVSIRATKAGFNGSDFYLSGRDPAARIILHRDGVCPADEALQKPALSAAIRP